jgi:exodeoxyribonuclease VII large subunit
MSTPLTEAGEPRCWSVFQLTTFIKNLLEGEDTLSAIRVKGEISNYKRFPSGHAYFDLKDAVSLIRCVMFKRSCDRLSFEPENGMQVVLSGRVSVYEKSGYYQIQVEEMRREGLGDLYAAYLKLKEKLASEGLFAVERKRKLPFLPRLVGIVTSPQAAALRDMLSIIGRRNDAVRIVISPALVQGKEAPPTLIRALRLLNRLGGVDVIIIGRGGGSFEDLNCFNDEALAREIAASGVPVISAVGHETDHTVADLVADARASTPSQAAQMVVQDKSQLLGRLEDLRERLINGLMARFRKEKTNLDSLLSRRALKHPLEILERRQQETDHLNQRMKGAVDRLVRVQRERLQSYTPARIGTAALHCLGRMNLRLSVLGGKLDALSPLKVLDRGYSLCLRGCDGGIVRSVRDATPGDELEVMLSDGRIYALATAVMEEAVSFQR